jgi:hypothetical protein
MHSEVVPVKHLLFRKYNESLPNLLKDVYPEYDWLPWKFEKVPLLFWDDIKNQQKFVKWAEKELKIKEMSDWYKVSVIVCVALVAIVTIRILGILVVHL